MTKDEVSKIRNAIDLIEVVGDRWAVQEAVKYLKEVIANK